MFAPDKPAWHKMCRKLNMSLDFGNFDYRVVGGVRLPIERRVDLVGMVIWEQVRKPPQRGDAL